MKHFIAIFKSLVIYSTQSYQGDLKISKYQTKVAFFDQKIYVQYVQSGSVQGPNYWGGLLDERSL